MNTRLEVTTMMWRGGRSAAIVLACTLIGACTRTVVVGVSPEVDTSVLYAANEGWPDDTAGGVYATGTAKPTAEITGAQQLKARAEYGALLRILGTLRNTKGFGAEVTESAFFACIEENSGHVYVKRESLPNGTVTASVFLAADAVEPVVACLKR